LPESNSARKNNGADLCLAKTSEPEKILVQQHVSVRRTTSVVPSSVVPNIPSTPAVRITTCG